MACKAIARSGEVLLEWKTASESGCFGFHIDRSVDVAHFQRITEHIIPGAGDSESENTYLYADKGLTNGTTYYYNLLSVDRDGVETVLNKTPISATPTMEVPSEFSLNQNCPNPFNPTTEITYSLPGGTHVTLRIYNIQGAHLATLVDMHQEAGLYTVRWNAEGQASGVYFCSFSGGDYTRTIKMVLMK